jgi:hypothetical protein
MNGIPPPEYIMMEGVPNLYAIRSIKLRDIRIVSMGVP